MNTILVITGSARPNSVNQVIVREVVKNLNKTNNLSVTIADLAELKLPFFDSPTVPSKIDASTTPDSVQQWSRLVSGSDGVVFVAPEYNHSLSGIQKNAMDWLYAEWRDKPTAYIGYGAYAGKNSYVAFKAVNDVLQMSLVATMAGIMLGEVVGYDGEILNQNKLDQLLSVTLDELIEATT